jgi:hypothetical protein
VASPVAAVIFSNACLVCAELVSAASRTIWAPFPGELFVAVLVGIFMTLSFLTFRVRKFVWERSFYQIGGQRELPSKFDKAELGIRYLTSIWRRYVFTFAIGNFIFWNLFGKLTCRSKGEPAQLELQLVRLNACQILIGALYPTANSHPKSFRCPIWKRTFRRSTLGSGHSADMLSGSRRD